MITLTLLARKTLEDPDDNPEEDLYKEEIYGYFPTDRLIRPVENPFRQFNKEAPMTSYFTTRNID